MFFFVVPLRLTSPVPASAWVSWLFAVSPQSRGTASASQTCAQPDNCQQQQICVLLHDLYEIIGYWHGTTPQNLFQVNNEVDFSGNSSLLQWCRKKLLLQCKNQSIGCYRSAMILFLLYFFFYGLLTSGQFFLTLVFSVRYRYQEYTEMFTAPYCLKSGFLMPANLWF